MKADVFLTAIAVGISGTIIFAAYALILRCVLLFPASIGIGWEAVRTYAQRRLLGMKILRALPIAGERALDWAFHNGIGIGYGFCFSPFAVRRGLHNRRGWSPPYSAWCF